MTVTFRSHDIHGAYALNLAALCLWLCEEARSLGMAVGTLTCMSQSAHVYARDYNAANEKIAAYRPAPIAYDQRSTWRVEVYETEERIAVTCTLRDNDGDDCDPCGAPAVVANGSRWFRCEAHIPRNGGMPLPKVKAIRAVCLTPDGNGITCIFEGKTATEIALQIERSGLITQTGNALWLGGELVKAEGRL
jgi:hypothetical protein